MRGLSVPSALCQRIQYVIGCSFQGSEAGRNRHRPDDDPTLRPTPASGGSSLVRTLRLSNLPRPTHRDRSLSTVPMPPYCAQTVGSGTATGNRTRAFVRARYGMLRARTKSELSRAGQFEPYRVPAEMGRCRTQGTLGIARAFPRHLP